MIPDFQIIMRPILEASTIDKPISISALTKIISDTFKLTDEERMELLPSGKQTIIANRVAWAKTHLVKAGLLDNTERGYVTLTPLGQQAIASGQPIKLKYLNQFESYKAFRSKVNDTSGLIEEKAHTQALAYRNDQSPLERIATAEQEMLAALSEDVLERLQKMDPYRFEQVVVDLLVKMGYGGNRSEAGKATKKSHDDGIDGVIKEDRLGLDKIYLQAKRYKDGAAVNRPEIDGFVGALTRHGVKKGVFITTSEFSKGAHVDNLKSDITVILIDGKKLVEYMIELNLGVSVLDTVVLKQIEESYFSE